MKRFTLLMAFLLLAGLLVACGGGAAEPASLDFEAMDSFAFNPNSATVPAGAEVSVTLDNTGALEHSWALLNEGVDPVTATDANAMAGASSGTVAAGSSSMFSFTAPDAGAYQFVCTVPGHAAAGMVGTLTVQ